MNSQILINAIRFLSIILLQVLVLNEIDLHGIISPIVYPLIILSLPFTTPIWLLMLIGLLSGLMVDSFCQTFGLHAAATVLIAFLRPYIIRLIEPQTGYNSDLNPSIPSLGLKWFLIYAGLAILIHQSFYFIIEIFSFQHFGRTIFKIFLSSTIGLLLILIIQWLFFRK